MTWPHQEEGRKGDWPNPMGRGAGEGAWPNPAGERGCSTVPTWPHWGGLDLAPGGAGREGKGAWHSHNPLGEGSVAQTHRGKGAWPGCNPLGGLGCGNLAVRKGSSTNCHGSPATKFLDLWGVPCAGCQGSTGWMVSTPALTHHIQCPFTLSFIFPRLFCAGPLPNLTSAIQEDEKPKMHTKSHTDPNHFGPASLYLHVAYSPLLPTLFMLQYLQSRDCLARGVSITSKMESLIRMFVLCMQKSHFLLHVLCFGLKLCTCTLNLATLPADYHFRSHSSLWKRTFISTWV